MADATDSKSVEGNFIRVRLPSSAPEAKTALLLVFVFLSEKLHPNICFRLFAPNVNSRKAANSARLIS